eukprot:gene11478-34194_t
MAQGAAGSKEDRQRLYAHSISTSPPSNGQKALSNIQLLTLTTDYSQDTELGAKKKILSSHSSISTRTKIHSPPPRESHHQTNQEKPDRWLHPELWDVGRRGLLTIVGAASTGALIGYLAGRSKGTDPNVDPSELKELLEMRSQAHFRRDFDGHVWVQGQDGRWSEIRLDPKVPSTVLLRSPDGYVSTMTLGLQQLNTPRKERHIAMSRVSPSPQGTLCLRHHDQNQDIAQCYVKGVTLSTKDTVPFVIMTKTRILHNAMSTGHSLHKEHRVFVITTETRYFAWCCVKGATLSSFNTVP